MRYGMILPVATVFAVAFSIEGGISMARKSRKHQPAKLIKAPANDSVGYIRLSVANKEEYSSIENQKFIIEYWGDQHQISVSQYYIDGYTGRNLNRPGFQELIGQCRAGKVGCIVVKDLSRLGRNYVEVGNLLEQVFPFLGVDRKSVV